jgi:alpha-glucosidase (family GH31 glycosyl hydrolase)
VPSEPIYREDKTKALARDAIRMRYRLLPYNYTLAFDNNQKGLPLMRPMLYEEPTNVKVRAMSSTYLWGKDFLVTPVLTAGATKADVYFPATSAWFDFYSGERQAGGATKSVKLSPDHVPVYVRAGAFIPMTRVVQTTRDYSTKNIELHYYHDSSVKTATGKLYDDDGLTAQAFEHGRYELLTFTSKVYRRGLSINIDSAIGDNYRRPERSIDLTVHNVSAKPASVRVDGTVAAFSWDAGSKLLTLVLPPNALPARTVNIAL